jgi:hypothetical protein
VREAELAERERALEDGLAAADERAVRARVEDELREDELALRERRVEERERRLELRRAELGAYVSRVQAGIARAS